MSLLRLFRELDIFRKIPSDLRMSTTSSAPASSNAIRVLHVIGIITVALLLGSAAVTYYSSAMSATSALIKRDFSVDEVNKAKMRVKIDIDIQKIPCAAISLDFQDVMGSRVVDVTSTVFKHRLKADGSSVFGVNDERNVPRDVLHSENRSAGGPKIRSRKPEDTNETCGNCYGAFPVDNCCDACNDVMYGYRLKRWALPRFEQIKQCHEEAAHTSTPGRQAAMPVVARDEVEVEIINEQMGEGCRVYGYFDTNKVPGNFHITTHGISRETWNSVALSTRQALSMMHKVNHMEFVDPLVNRTVVTPLANRPPPPVSGATASYQYYISVTPVTSIKGETGFSYNANSFESNDSAALTPGIFFRFEIDPIRVTYSDKAKRFPEFLTEVLAILGGCVAVMIMLTRVVENATDKIE